MRNHGIEMKQEQMLWVMMIPLLIFSLVIAILTRAFDAASMLLLFLLFRICYEVMRMRAVNAKEEAERNEAVRISNAEKRKKVAQREAEMSLKDLLNNSPL